MKLAPDMRTKITNKQQSTVSCRRGRLRAILTRMQTHTNANNAWVVACSMPYSYTQDTHTNKNMYFAKGKETKKT